MTSSAGRSGRVLPAAIHLDFSPEVKMISRTSRYVCDFYRGVLADEDASARVMMAAHELLENAAKYSSDGTGRLHIELCKNGGRDVVRIRTSNRARPEKLGELREFFEENGRCADAIQLYDRLIARSASRPVGSGLGLARIRAEGDMELSCSIQGDEVTITAETPVEIKDEAWARLPSHQS